MATLMVLVDYDNIEPAFNQGGPVALAKVICTALPTGLTSIHEEVRIRLYGGWRENGVLTTFAQRLIPVIRADSPTYISIQHGGAVSKTRLVVELAEAPIGSSAILENMMVKERSIRKFRARKSTIHSCASPSACGFGHLSALNHSTRCSTASCSTRLEALFVRDEQKMVDTLMVADMAHTAYSLKAKEIVIVSSDTDVWPGVLLALGSGCAVTHFHTKPGYKTQRALLGTLPASASTFYYQTSF